ncbi:MAG: outer membrane beta-barrel protein [Bacteroidetes bacterium]|nr:outer membrane beta-barrel protein [Bacteroidota bacterium]
MKRIFFIGILIVNICHAQDHTFQGEIIAGVSGYNGDLTSKLIDTKTWHAAYGANLRYQLNDYFALRLGLLQASVSGNDKYSSKPDFKNRNLSFQSNIFESTLCMEINIFSSETYDLYPYVFFGVGYFHFNPYAYDSNSNKIYLRPLSTEGEGLAAYPARKQYSLNQFCVPFGIGVKKKISSDIDLALELNFRKLYTDYLDDVSKTYVNYGTLLEAKGSKATEMAFRNLDGVIPRDGKIRGNPKKNDTYYYAGIKFIYYFNPGGN